MIVVGLGFGDEGKGATVAHLCNTHDRAVVVRFNGGHQAGHTVVSEKGRHIFSTYGSGTLHGAETYLSEFCTFNPIAAINEHIILERLIGTVPSLTLHPEVMLTTPFDIQYNQKLENSRVSDGEHVHGSVGVGFGTTIERNEHHYRLYARDLKYPIVFKIKLDKIRQYYIKEFGIKVSDEIYNEYLSDAYKMSQIVGILDYDDYTYSFRIFPNYIAEGAQGILLDQKYGFFPNVTRSNTTSKNAIYVLRELYRDQTYCPEIFYVTRTYQTRHGEGPMSDAEFDDEIYTRNVKETNIHNKYQGSFMKAGLDVDMLNYALDCDYTHLEDNVKYLVVTCYDQYPINVEYLSRKINTVFSNILISNSEVCSTSNFKKM